LTEFYNFVDEVVNEVSGKKNPIKWIVSVRRGSIILENQPEYIQDVPPIISDKIFQTIDKGFRILEKQARRPTNFTDKALEHLQNLAAIPQTRSNGLEKISIAVNRKSHVLSKHVVANVDLVLGEYSRAIGSVEGTLETISVKGHKERLYVFDSLTNRRILCDVTEEMMLEALTPKVFGRRVYVFGMISYSKDGSPRRIRADELKVLNNRENPPSILKMCGILGG